MRRARRGSGNVGRARVAKVPFARRATGAGYEGLDLVGLWYPSKEACLRDNPPLPPQLAAELARGHGCS